ncbi:MAG TPA: NIPSNAP family protein [Nitrospinota bacterium]|nr:NIPSNAP family protein [Nitrospinota bacterium]
MIYELRTYTTKPGQAMVHVKNSGTLGREIRGDNYGKLVGHWMTEIGPLNQSMHMWEYNDLNERAEKRAALAKLDRWQNEYRPANGDAIMRQDIRLMNAVIAPKAPENPGNVYEFRNYRLRPGTIGKWCDVFTGALPVREKYSKIVGLWTTEAGQPNEVCHIWAYKDLAARTEARAAAAGDPGWQAFLKEGGPLIEEMWSTLMLPADHSPLK